MGLFTLTTHPVTAEFNGVNDPESYSGARVARMILTSLGLANPLAAQPMLDYAAARNDPGEGAPFWFIDPGAMQHTLVDFDPRGGAFPGHWRIYTNTDSTAANAQIRWTLDNYGVAAAALTNGGKHWLLVVGYLFDDATQATTDFVIDDPAYDGGGANLAVSLNLWNTAYTPVAGGVNWLNKIVEVGDPNPGDEMPPQARRLIVRTAGTIIPPAEAVKLAVDGAKARYCELPNVKYALDKGKPGNPQLVARLDVPGSYYYLVPLNVKVEKEERTLAVIMVDARFGDILSVSASHEPYIPWPITHDHARDLVTRHPIPVFESVRAATDRLIDAISCRQNQQNAEFTASNLLPNTPCGNPLRDTVTAALGSFASPSSHLVLGPSEIELCGAWAWHPYSGVSPFHPYYVVRSNWHNLYVNVHDGSLRFGFEDLFWTRLGA